MAVHKDDVRLILWALTIMFSLPLTAFILAIVWPGSSEGC